MIINGQLRNLEEDIILIKKQAQYRCTVDRIVIKEGIESRLSDSLN